MQSCLTNGSTAVGVVSKASVPTMMGCLHDSGGPRESCRCGGTRCEADAAARDGQAPITSGRLLAAAAQLAWAFWWNNEWYVVKICMGQSMIMMDRAFLIYFVIISPLSCKRLLENWLTSQLSKICMSPSIIVITKARAYYTVSIYFSNSLPQGNLKSPVNRVKVYNVT